MKTCDTTFEISRPLRRRLVLCLAVVVFHGALVVRMAWSQPRRWSDDFETRATYNSTSWLAPCYDGESTKYTVMEDVVGDIANARALSDGGKLIFTNRLYKADPYLRRKEPVFIGALNLGQGCPDVAGIPYRHSTESFTSPNICIYGGVSFTRWHLRVWDDPKRVNDPFGPDGEPGVANVDDDGNEGTDEDDEGLALRPTTVNGGYGNRNGTGFRAGQDDAPGVVGVDDDGNGITDEIGETGWDGSDDGDDTPGFIVWEVFMRGDIETQERIFLQITPTNGEGKTLGGPCTIRHPFGLGATEAPYVYQAHLLEAGDEAVLGYLTWDTVYNYVFCGSGTCYGAMIMDGGGHGQPG